MNVRNIRNKFEQFEAWVHDTNPDITGISESWLTSCILDSECALNGYDMFRQDRLLTEKEEEFYCM